MFVRFSTFIPIAALVAVATAAPNQLVARQNSNGCSTPANVYCCDQLAGVNSEIATIVAEMFNVNLDGGLPIGLNCTATNGIGGSTSSGASCTQNPVCCEGNTFNQHSIVTECSPVTINCNGFELSDCTITHGSS